MPQPNMVKEAEIFRHSVMTAIDNLQVSDQQKQVFILNFQGLYLEMLPELFQANNTTESSIALAEIVN
jgi:hypothetical protein